MYLLRVTRLVLALLLLTPVISAAQPPPPTPDALKRSITEKVEQLNDQLMALIDQLQPIAVINTAAQLQAALDAGGVVDLPPLAAFTAGRFTISKPSTTLNCHGALLVGMTGPALHIRPGAHDAVLDDCTYGSAWNGAVLQCGDNDRVTQGLAALVPQRVQIRNPRILTHRGKRGIEVNCAGVISNPQIADVYSGEVNPQDSQAIAVINTCGPVTVRGGSLVGGSENFIIGGDRLQVADCPEGVVTDVLLDDVTLTKPEAWRLAQTRVAPKNVVELKAGKRVTVRNSRINGSWKGGVGAGATQDGSCIVITPKNAQYIADVLFENNVIERCAQGLQLMGQDYNSVTPHPTTGVVFRGNRWTIDGPTYGGRGILASIVGGMQDVLFENETVVQTGTALFLVDSGTDVGPFLVRNSRMTTGRLVCAAPGVNYCSPPPVGRIVFSVGFEGNTLTGPPLAFSSRYPQNKFVARDVFDQLLAAPVIK